MKFYLTYKGSLRSSGNQQKRSPHKHSIRREFHQQLKRLWEIDEGLQSYKELRRFDEPDKTYFEPDIVGEYKFVSLARKEFKLSCSLDILFLRSDSLLRSVGDVDNRIKTLLDSLRRPSEGELKDEDSIPKADEDPFYCLLEDDDQIGSFAVKVYPFLGPANKADEVKLIITVELNPSVHTMLNSGFL